MNTINKSYFHFPAIFVLNFLLGIFPIPGLFDSAEKSQLFIYFASIAMISTLMTIGYWYLLQKLIKKMNRISQDRLIETLYVAVFYLFGFSFFISTQKLISFDPIVLAIIFNLLPWLIFIVYNKSISSWDDFAHSLFKFAIPHFVLHQLLFAMMTLAIAMVATGFTSNFS
jgi:hypothetical protein